MALHSPPSKAGGIGVSSHAILSIDRPLFRSDANTSERASRKQGAHLRGGLIGWRRDDPDMYDLRKGSVVTVELLTTVYVA